jgi:hypothetical protein
MIYQLPDNIPLAFFMMHIHIPEQIPVLIQEQEQVHVQPTNLTFYEQNWNLAFLFDMPFGISYDFNQMRANTAVFKNELISKAYHPSRITKWLELGWNPNA